MSRRVAVLASGAGTNLQALLDHGPPIDVTAVVTDRPEVGALARADAAGVPSQHIDFGAYPDRGSWERDLTEALTEVSPDVVVLAGFMRVLSADVVARWPMVNVHPSLLPAFPGARAIRAALDHGVKVSGTTVHFVEEDVDAGPIIAQQAVDVEPDDTVESLQQRIQAVEHRLLPRCVTWLCEDRLEVRGRHVRLRDAAFPSASEGARP